MTKYQLTLLLDPNLAEKEVEEVSEEVKKQLSSSSTIEKIENLGRKQLATPLKKKTHGYYLNFLFNSKDSQVTKLITNKLRVNKKILRFLVVLKTS